MRRRSERRGVLLLVMLSMLSLLAVIVITYVVVAGIKKRAAGAYEREAFYGTPPDELLQSVALDLLRDTRNPASALQGHSLLADLYGEDGVIGLVPPTAAVQPVGLVGSQTLVDRQLFEFPVDVSNLVYYEHPTVQPPGRLFDGNFSGCVITFLEGPFRNLSGRIVDYRAPANGAATGAGKLVVAAPASSAGQQALAQLPGVRFVINGRPFNGVGAGFIRQPGAPDGTTSLTTNVIGVDGSPFPNAGVVRLPIAFALNHTNAAVRTTLDPAIGSQASQSIYDEDYDAPDYMNPALAMMVPNPRAGNPTQPESSFSPSGSVVLKPSFYLPGLQSFYEEQLGLNTTPGSLGADLRYARLWSMISLRPNPVLHPGFARQNPRLNPVGSNSTYDPYYQNPMSGGTFTPPPWDVDNTGDGLPDSIWIDPGLPVQTAADGRRYKVLAAILCVDMDGRLNVNAHGAPQVLQTVTQRTPLVGPYAQDTLAALGTPPPIMLADATDAVNVGGEEVYRGLGYGPADVDLGLFDSQRLDRPPYLRQEEYFALLGGMQSSDLAGVPANSPVAGRYGADGVPGFTGSDSGLAARQPELLPITVNSLWNWTAYSVPFDFAGTGAIALDHRGQPVYLGMGGRSYNGGPSVPVENPYEFEPASSRSASGWWQSITGMSQNPRSPGPVPRDDPYSPGELERLLRWHDSDADSLPDRLLEVAKVGMRSRFGGPFDVMPPTMLDHETGAAENQGGLNNSVYLRQFQDAGRLRAMTTTESWDLPVPNLSTPADLHEVISTVLGYEPLHVSDLLVARIAQANNWGSPQVFGTDQDAATRRQAINAAIQFYLSSEMRAGLRFNLNRPFGDGVDNDGDNLVDEGGAPQPNNLAAPGEIAPPSSDPADVAFVELMNANEDPTVRKPFPLHASNGDRLAPLQTNLVTNDAMVRQIYARHLYLLAQMLVESEYAFPQRMLAGGIPESPAAARARALAQWAVNVVDYRDRDSVMTFFEYDIHPFVDDDANQQNGFWDVDGFPSTDEDTPTAETYRGVVWGAEKPELLITETMAWHDHRLGYNDDPQVADWVAYARPVGSLLIELYNPRDPGAAGGELDVNNAGDLFAPGGNRIGGVALDKVAPGGSPVWRMVLADPNDPKLANNWAMDAIAPSYEPIRPDHISAAAYFTPGDLQNGASQQNLTFPDGSQANVSVRDGLPNNMIRFAAARGQSNLVVPPGSYAVAGSISKSTRPNQGDRIFMGSNAEVFGGGDKSDAPVYPLFLQFRGNGDLAATGADFLMFGSTGAANEVRKTGQLRKQAIGIAMAPSYTEDSGQSWVFQGPNDETEGAGTWRKLRFSVSEPARGYEIVTEDNLEEDFYDPLNSPGQLPSPMAGEPKSPDDSLQTLNEKRVVGTGLDTQSSKTSPTRERHAVVYLQRLADPSRPFNALDNPYISVDSSLIDVHAYTGDRRATDPPFITDNGELKIQSRERGVAGAGVSAQRQNVWFGRSPANARQLQTTPLPDANFDIANINNYMSFGYLNTTFGQPLASNQTDPQHLGDPLPSVAPGTPGGPFPWFPWADRPLVSAGELLLIPMHSPRAMLSRHTPRGVGAADDNDPFHSVDANNPGGSQRRAGEGEFFHLPNWFGSHRHVGQAGGGDDDGGAPELHRILEFVHVPSRFSGLEDELFPTPIMASTQQMGQFRPWLDDLHIWPGFHYLNHYREPGRVNANTVFSPDVWHCVTGALPAPRFEDLVASRRGYQASGSAILSPYVHNRLSTLDVLPSGQQRQKIFPSLISNPFRSFAGGSRQPLVRATGTNRWDVDLRLDREIDATFYRAEGIREGGGNLTTQHEATDPLLSPDDDAAAYNRANYNDERNPYYRYQGHQKLSNLLTTRSNVYAVWITIGYFEVQPIRTQNGYAPPFNQLPAGQADQIIAEIVPDGWQIGPELGSETGDFKRHRAFYLIDRTIPVGYLRGEDLNVDKAMMIQRFIE